MRARPSTMVARSPFYERKAKEQHETKLQKKRREICLACTKEECNGMRELMRRSNFNGQKKFGK